MQQCHQCGVSLGEEDRFCRGCGAAADSPESHQDRLVGRVIAGSYVVQDLVGVGGMGRVYRAEQRMLGRTVAIKVVHPHLLSDEQSVARFYTEARAASRLNHPNSVSIIDFGRTDEGILYLVMEFLQGRDLSRLMLEDGPLPLTRVGEIVCAVLDALAEAHALSVVHRDLKPENVIIERLRSGGDLVKVVDFGLAKLLGGGGSAGTGITLPGLVCGTPDYMSPEQGRGEEVDARGDIYSVGVMLFELITGQLPYIADTPTNVVLKHIQDPVPDPREVAPSRMVPEGLATLVMRALAKNPEERFASAEEMSRALRAILRRMRPSDLAMACGECGHHNSLSSKFCANCGSPLQARTPPPTHRLSLPPRLDLHAGGLPMVARNGELAAFKEWQEEAREGVPEAVLLGGEVGVGRTRLLTALAEVSESAGQLVVGAGPHPSGAPVPYYPVACIVRSLLSLDSDGLLALRDELMDVAPLVAAGIDELVQPAGLRGADGESRAPAVATALLYAIDKALAENESPRALVMIDDLNLCDGLTQEVAVALSETTQSVSSTFVFVDQPGRDKRLASRCRRIGLRSLTLFEARAMFSRRSYHSSREPDPDDELFLPLFVDQIRELGVHIDEKRFSRPARLADAVTQRVGRLSLGARLLLQAISVLGNRCERTLVDRLAPTDSSAHMTVLVGQGLIIMTDTHVEVAHPFIRDLVEASIPAEARKDLHARALSLANEVGMPLEVRAHHAFGSGEALGALVLLERMGDLALARGDLGTAVMGYQRALSLSRRELLETGDTYLEGAIESISRRLGNALIRRGDITGAEGVLREALEYSAPSSTHRAQIHIGLSEVLADKQRMREAYRLLGQALEIAIHNDAEAAQVDIQMAVARLRRMEGNLKGAIAALRTAEELLTDEEPDRLRRAQLAVEVARCLVDQRKREEALAAVEEARRLAEVAEAPYLASRALGISARYHQAIGESDKAQELYTLAAALAERAGDGRLAARFRSLSIADSATLPMPRAGSSDTP